jgi:hypothetical protein
MVKTYLNGGKPNHYEKPVQQRRVDRSFSAQNRKQLSEKRISQGKLIVMMMHLLTT